MTASWLKQMGWKDVFVFAEAGHETGMPATPMIGPQPPASARIDCDALAALLERNATTVVDLSLSPNYRKGHIGGAWFAIRSRLERALSNIALRGDVVLTSEDGVLAGLAVAEASTLTGHPVRYLDGGNAAWQSAGLTLSTEPHMADDALDVWLKPYERAGDTKDAMSEYLSWEVDLVERIERDGTCHFSH
jgi:3-mercaptopyruvate sulfurtransferase SseA